MSAVERVSLEDFSKELSSLTELSSVALGGRIVSVSDEFFAAAHHLLLVDPAPSMKGQFGPNGALFSGWETRRHNPTYDWCIVQLGTTGSIKGLDVDTANFNGNEAPAVTIYALLDPDLNDPQHDDYRWTEIVPKADLGPNSRHFFRLSPTQGYNYVKIHMHPDGGIARFRVYGDVYPVHPTDPRAMFDLAHVFAGGRVIRVSDQHFGVGSNLILPGRGINMGDGWETKRSRTKGHKDWVIIQLGAPGLLSEIEIDTNHFLGNFPESCEIHALCLAATSDNDYDWNTAGVDNTQWTLILPRTKLGPGKQHWFELENVEDKIYTHIKVTIHPDGGLKRVRIIGQKMESALVASESVTQTSSSTSSISSWTPPTTQQSNINVIPIVPLTPEAFAPYGQVIQAYPTGHPTRRSVKVTPANAGTAEKFHKLALLSSSYPTAAGATAGVSIYRCQPLHDISDGITVLRTLERHPHTNQAFIPMGRGDREGLEDPADSYLVVVTHNGYDDRPDMSTLKAFIASAAQGISYNAGIWHQPMTVLGKALDLACIETQIGDGGSLDCEILDLDPNSTYILKFSD